jgi:hypothetical protein
MNKVLLLILSVTTILSGCIKPVVSEKSNCENIKNATITSNSPVTIGQTIKFGTKEVGGYRIYDWSGPNFFDGQEPSDSFTDAQLTHEGWYYLHLYSLDANCEKFDSVYIDVKLQQGNPSCSITNNTAQFSNLFDDTFTSVSKTIDGGTSLKKLSASGPNGANITIFFHPQWANKEPEDGIYTTVNILSFSGNYNKVFVTTTKSSIYWSSREGYNVYVSHVNGKLQVRFCGLSMGGYNGTSYTTIASGNIIQL